MVPLVGIMFSNIVMGVTNYPVSYTHLDVYKRQGLDSSRLHRNRFCLSTGTSSRPHSANSASGPHHCIKPVSYTHLTIW